MGQPAARSTDTAVELESDPADPRPPVQTLEEFASPTVEIGGAPAAAGPEGTTSTVLIGGEPALRSGDVVTITGKEYRIQLGAPTVLIGD